MKNELSKEEAEKRENSTRKNNKKKEIFPTTNKNLRKIQTKSDLLRLIYFS